LGETGYWEDINAPVRFRSVLTGDGDDEMRKGRLHLHPITTPVIQVASDGQTAKETWITLDIGIMRD
jgi:hypothetical protein